jgi:hypothetical protein
MRRVSVVVVVALLNALVFGVKGSASSLQTGTQDKEIARQEAIKRDARRIPPGVAVRVERINGIRVEGLFDRVNDDGDIEILQVTQGHRETVIIPARDVKRLGPLRGRPLNSFAKKAGITVAVLLGACVGLAAAGAFDGR